MHCSPGSSNTHIPVRHLVPANLDTTDTTDDKRDDERDDKRDDKCDDKRGDKRDDKRGDKSDNKHDQKRRENRNDWFGSRHNRNPEDKSFKKCFGVLCSKTDLSGRRAPMSRDVRDTDRGNGRHSSSIVRKGFIGQASSSGGLHGGELPVRDFFISRVHKDDGVQ